MSYLESEIDEALLALEVEGRKLSSIELSLLISNLSQKFFNAKMNVLDPNYLNIKSTEHNPIFWKEVQDKICGNRLIFIVCDTEQRAWEIDNSQSLARILSETTGYPFWVTDHALSFLVHMDDHDCVSWACAVVRSKLDLEPISPHNRLTK
ncbi:hypothetical protein [Pseudomonas fluorescens]|uniref:hypothetical protein n=1 Tax=Pseudomonas fluorescens TaxID=294 RepID=UPI001BE991F1|nr:hypothetical protein [Pseudomonas fluorescens]MBT2371260.1 hypothetical protein [Pseudomonas fluorescens]